VNYDAIIVGGGAAGLFCAIAAGKRGRRVLVIEHNADVGRKILISGGGRCNFTNLNTGPDNFLSQNPHFCKSALSRFTPADFVTLVKKHKIQFYEKKLGQLFCRESSRQIVDMLLKECRNANVVIQTGCRVASVMRDDRGFRLDTSHGTVRSEKFIIATGGLSFPKIGATDFGYRIARQFGLKIIETRPSLVAMVLKGDTYADLAGVSANAIVQTGKYSFRENILFTHRGLSGPAILQISNYWLPNMTVTINLAPDNDLSEQIAADREKRQKLSNYLSAFVPAGVARRFTEKAAMDQSLTEMSRQDIKSIGQLINSWQVRFADTEGYDRAEVTLGGVSTAELSSQTMEVKKVAGLFFIGEAVDVTGWLGGYNFQWAWSSGYAAGNSI
jgi:predicted Rossmann fold flavoprotein